MASSAQTLVNAAVALGYDALDDRSLRECLLYAAQTGGGGGGGTGGGTVDPTTPGTTTGQIYTNFTTDTIWAWDGSNWIKLLG